jgi:hypothetical protein
MFGGGDGSGVGGGSGSNGISGIIFVVVRQQ